MKITILGSGTFVPELNRKCSSYLIENEENKIVIDFGRGVIDRLLKLKISLYELRHIFISHMHVDHSSELASFLLFILDAPEKKKLRLPYTIYGPKGIKRDLQNMLKTFHLDRHKNLNRMNINEIPEGANVKIGKIKIKSFEIKHSRITKCFAYKIFEGKKSICYSGDSRYCNELKNACQSVDVAILDSTGPREWKLPEHMNGDDAGKIAKESNVKKLIVTHVGDKYLSKVKKDVRKEYKGKLNIAKDLMRIKI